MTTMRPMSAQQSTPLLDSIATTADIRTLERKQIFQRPRKAQGVQVFDFCSNR